VTVTLCDTNIVKQIHRKSHGWDASHQNKEELLKAIKSAVIKTVNIEKNISGEESCQKLALCEILLASTTSLLAKMHCLTKY